MNILKYILIRIIKTFLMLYKENWILFDIFDKRFIINRSTVSSRRLRNSQISTENIPTTLQSYCNVIETCSVAATLL